MTATDLAGRYPVTRQALVKHLSALSSAGLLHSERRGREVLYGVVPHSLSGATDWLTEVGRRWDVRIQALSEHLEER